MKPFRSRQSRGFSHTSISVVAVAGSIAIAALAISSPGALGVGIASAATASPYSLASVCPSTITIQTGWDPAVGNDYDLYQLESLNGAIDANSKSYTGELVAHGHDTGVKLQLLAGGKVVDYESGGELLEQHSNILLADDNDDTNIVDSSKVLMVDLVSDYNNDAQDIIWSPHAYPNVTKISQLAATNAPVLYSEGAYYMTYFTNKGVLKTSQGSPSYTGSAAQYIAAAGKDAQQGYITAMQYPNTKIVPADLLPLRAQLISDYGYNPYENSLGTLPADVQKYSACFSKLIPIIQQAGVDYYANPTPANQLIVKLVNAYNDGWAYSMEDAVYAEKQMLAYGVVANSPSGVFGAESTARVSRLLSILTPILKSAGTPARAGLTVSQLYDGQFIDKSIHLNAGDPKPLKVS